MANQKEFTYSVNIDTKQATDNLTKATLKIDATGKSIAELSKLLRQQMAIFKQLTAEQRESELGKNIQQNIKNIQQELKKANNSIKNFSEEGSKDIGKIGNAISKELKADRIIAGLDKLKNMTQFESLEDGFNNVADAIGNLDPRLKLVAEVGKFAFQEILKEISLTDGGAKKLAGTLGGLKEAFSLKNIIGLLNPITSFSTAKKIADDFRKGELIAQEKFERERENVVLEANKRIIDAEIKRNDVIAKDNNRTFEEQKNALIARRDAELKFSAQNELIAKNQLQIFLNQKSIRELRERQGANFVNNLNAEQLKEYTELQAKIIAETENRIAAQEAFEKDLAEKIRQERERQLQIFKALKQKEIDANEFNIQNERKTLQETLALAEKNFNAKKQIIQNELSVLDAKNKQDQVRAIELANEKIKLEREFQLQKQAISQEFLQREIQLQELKNTSIIELNNKYNELFRGTLQEQIDRIKDNTQLQLDLNAQKINALNQQDKDYYIKLEQLEQEKQKIIAESNAKITQQTLAFYDSELNNIAQQLEILATKRATRLNQLQSDFAQATAEINKKIAEADELANNAFRFIQKIPELKKSYTDLYQTRIQQLEEQANREKELNDKQIQYNKSQIQRLQKELELGDQISEIRKQEIKNQIALIEAQVEELEGKKATIDVKLKLDADEAKKEFDKNLESINEKTLQSIDKTISKVNEAFKIVSDFGNAVIELQLQQQLKAIEAEEERINKSIEMNEKLLEDLNKREQKATGARAKRIRKEIEAQEERIANEKAQKEQLEQEKIEAERKANEKRKIFQIGQVIIDTAAGVAKAVAQFPQTFGLPFSAFVAATGALQIATIQAQKFSRGGIAIEGGYIPAEGGMISGNSHAQGGVKFYMRGGRIGEADGVKGEAYIVNTKHNPILKKLASDINVMGGGKAFFAQGGAVNSLLPSALGLNIENPFDKVGKEIIDAINQEKVVLPVNTLTEAMQDYLNQTKRKKI